MGRSGRPEDRLQRGPGVVIREYRTDIGPADYVLFVDRKPIGVVEAKLEDWGHRITTVESQSARYATAELRWVNNDEPLPFVYESTSVLTRFTDMRDPKPRSREVFDYRTNIHHTLKKPMRFEDLADFVRCYNPLNRHATWHQHDAPEGRWRSYSYEDLTAREKTSLDVFWLKDKSLTNLDNLPDPDDLCRRNHREPRSRARQLPPSAGPSQASG